MGADVCAGVDVVDGQFVFARHRTNPTSHPQFQAFASAGHWSRGRAALCVALGPNSDSWVRGDASAFDARGAHSFFTHDPEIVR